MACEASSLCGSQRRGVLGATVVCTDSKDTPVLGLNLSAEAACEKDKNIPVEVRVRDVFLELCDDIVVTCEAIDNNTAGDGGKKLEFYMDYIATAQQLVPLDTFMAGLELHLCPISMEICEIIRFLYNEFCSRCLSRHPVA